MTDRAASQHWHRVEAHFHRALDAPSDTREALVLDWCREEPDIAADVLALLRADSQVDALMASHEVSVEHALLREPATPTSGGDLWLGRRLGPFLIDRELGRGGMGVVYLGHRQDGALTQTVAIKVIARHLRHSPAMSQFSSERDVLGRLEHPHIARLIDGGIHDGTPYVVMEYVQGRRIDEVCDDSTLSVKAKMRLFLQLCDAVAYVHGQLILHRDLKPGNVLVTGSGEVKLLDFGTLKRIDVQAADSLMTRAGLRSVTLRYASPELLAGHRVSTATDIYSLGLILHRLLAGALPPELPDLAHREFSVSLAAVDAPASLRRDLAAIIAKALRPEPAARFSSVDALAQDLRNALSHRPVTARDGTLRYRAGRFYLRHRASVLGSVFVGSALGLGVIAVARQGAIAQAETLRAHAGVEDERKLSHLLLFDYFEQLKAIPGSTDAQRRAVTQALQYLDRLAPEADDALKQDRIDAYTKMGNLLGNPYEENIGDSARALATLRKAVTLSHDWLQDRPDDLHALQSSAAAEQSLGRVYFGSGDPQHAVLHLKPAADISRHIADLPGVDVPTLAQAASVVDSLGDVYGQEGAVTLDDPRSAIAAYEEAQAIDARGLSQDAGCARCRRGVALEYWKIGMLTEARDQDAAQAAYERGLETLAQFSSADQATARVKRIDTVTRQRLGVLLIAAGRAPQGIAMLSEVQQRFRSAVREDPTDTRAAFDLAALDQALAVGYEHLSRTKEALMVDREYLDTMTALVAQDHKNLIWRMHRGEALAHLGLALMAIHDEGHGRPDLDEGIAVLMPLAKDPDADATALGLAAAALLDAHRDAGIALEFAARAAAKQPMSVPALITLARAQRAAGHVSESRSAAQRALDLLNTHPNSMGHAEEAAQARALA